MGTTANPHSTGPLRYDGRVAIVTGAGGNPGLGRSYALYLAARGARVVVNDIGVGPAGTDPAETGAADAVVREIRERGGEAVPDANSVATRDGAARIVQHAVDQWGRVDIVVNNAGIAPFAKFDEISDIDIQRIIDVHLMGHIWMSRAAWPQMTDQHYGRFVQVSSGVAIRGLPYQSIYAAAKLGIVGLTRGMAAEGHAVGIRVNAIMPAADTRAWQTMLEPGFSEQARAEGLYADTIAPLVGYLAHDTCAYSGKIIDARGGALREVFFGLTRGTPPDAGLTAELVAERITTVIERAGAELVPDPDGLLPTGFTPKAYATAERGQR
jgi:NAD(P)-dependent dehydrogenase (short-subunit alcohol dehydrogenase family)